MTDLDLLIDPTRRPSASRSKRLKRPLAVLGLLAGAAAVVHLTGLWELVSERDRFQEFVDGAGLLGPVVFVVLFTFLVPVGVPGLVFVLPGSVVFSPVTAFGLCLLGGYTSSAIGVVAARTGGRATLARKLPARFRAWDERIARRGLLAVITLRIITYLTAPADWLLGLSSVRARTIVLGTVIGLIPPTAMYTFVGGGIFDLFT